jgi:hypothetical protein
MSAKKINNLNEVKELFKNYVKPTVIGSLELTPELATFKANNIIRVCQMALTGINESWSNLKVSELNQHAKTDLYDIAETLEIATNLLPIVEMEFVEKLQTNLID